MNKTEKQIAKLAKGFPVRYYVYRQTFRVTKDDIRDYGLNLCDHEYYLTMPIRKPINWGRRLRKAYQRNGVAGVKHFINSL